VERVEGEAHAQVFWVVCEVQAPAIRAQGSGSSRRRAEQEAAERVLQQIAQLSTDK
jgi:ribonuclease-3